MLGGLGFATSSELRYQAWDSSATYLLTKELRPENGTPRVNHPVFGPETAGGGRRGWGLGTGVPLLWDSRNEPASSSTTSLRLSLCHLRQAHEQFTAGVSWYLNYWVRFQSTSILTA